MSDSIHYISDTNNQFPLKDVKSNPIKASGDDVAMHYIGNQKNKVAESDIIETTRFEKYRNQLRTESEVRKELVEEMQKKYSAQSNIPTSTIDHIAQEFLTSSIND